MARQAKPTPLAQADVALLTLQRVAEVVIEPKHAVAFRELLKRVRRDTFGDNQAAMARAFDLTPAYISDVLLEKRGIGLKLVRAISRLTGHSLEDLIDGVALTPDPYPARAKALYCARTAAHAVQQREVGGAEGRSLDWWMRRLREEEDRAVESLEQSASPAGPAAPAMGETSAADENGWKSKESA